MMKHLLFSFLFFFALSSVYAQADRMVIVEEFTNASCVPCDAQNPAFNALLDQNLDKVIPIKYQTAFPGFDPYNEQNPGEVTTRLNRYNEITGVPTAAIDGVVPENDYGGGGLSQWTDGQGGGYPGGPYGYNQEVLDYATSVPTSLGVDLSVDLPNFGPDGTVSVEITNFDSVEWSDDATLHVALLERENLWPFPPGSTSEAEFFYIMRKMYPNANGTSLSAIPADTSSVVEVAIQIPDYIYNLDEMVVVAFIQSNDDRSIYNANITEPLPVDSSLANIALGENTTTSAGPLCDRVLNPSVTVINSGTQNINSFVINLIIDGEETSQTVTDTLGAGEETEVTFDEVSLPGGDNNVSFTIGEVNGSNARPVNLLGVELEPSNFPAVEVTSEEQLMYNFENDEPLSASAEGVILENPADFLSIVDRNSFQNAPARTGGYGMSDQSILVNFYQWQIPQIPARGQILLAKQFNIPMGASELNISFDRAHAQYNDPASNDRLEGYISYDCGENWTKVYDKAGADLKTTDPVEPFFVPNASQWATDTITITDFESSEALFKFEVVSDWGNNLFLDNIQVESMTTSANNPISVVNDPSVFPNPSSGQSTLQFELQERQRINIAIYDALGQQVTTVDERVFDAGFYRLPLLLNSYSSGKYRIVFTSQKGMSAIPLVIIK